MAKYYGKLGYAETLETEPGIWEEVITDKFYRGDVIRNTRKLDSGEGLNDNVMVNNTISIVADAYAYEHFFNLRYVEWMGALWKVTKVEVQRPRLTLTIGGLYNAAQN